MPGLGPPAASTTAAPAATGTAASERNFPTAEFTHACPFEGCLRHLTMKRYQGGEISTQIGVHHPVVILLDAATGVNGRRRAPPRYRPVPRMFVAIKDVSSRYRCRAWLAALNPLDWRYLPKSLSQWRSGVTGCLLGELDTGSQVEFGVDVREVG
jgi:hypothetical protein